MYVVGVCLHANPADGQPTQFACDFKFCWGLTSPRQFRTSEHGADRNYACGWQRMERNTFHVIVAKSWLLCILASLPTSRPALHDVQIEQWSINQRTLFGLEATVEGASVQDHCPQPLLLLLLHSWWRKYFSCAPLLNMTQLHHSKTVKYRRTRTHAANIQTLHAHKRSVQHPITATARVV